MLSHIQIFWYNPAQGFTAKELLIGIEISKGKPEIT